MPKLIFSYLHNEEITQRNPLETLMDLFLAPSCFLLSDVTESLVWSGLRLQAI